MAGRKDRQPARHRFQHRVRNAFLISVPSGFAGMQKNVRVIKKLAQLFLRDEARETNGLREVKFARERLQFGELRSFAGNREPRGRELLPEFGKCAQRRFQSFFSNQPPRLQQTPLAVARNAAFAKWKFTHRDSGALNFDFLRSAAEIDHRLPE